MSHHQFIVAGIDTEIGKTVVSAIFCEALQADYWKPIQSGDLDHTDSDKVAELITNSKAKILPEGIRLKAAMSPHAAADLEKLTILPSDLVLPKSDNDLVVELAGGLMVPINHQYLNIDLVTDLGLPVVLVSKYYLGNINHTLLSWQLLKDRNIPFLGFVFNGQKNQATFDVIMSYTKAACLMEINEESEITASVIKQYADGFKGF